MRTKILLMTGALLAAFVGVGLTAGPALAVTCFADHQSASQPQDDGSTVSYKGVVNCSATTTFTMNTTLTKNGTVVDTSSATVTRMGSVLQSSASDPSGLQYWCGKISATWSSGSSATGYQCQYH